MLRNLECAFTECAAGCDLTDKVSAESLTFHQLFSDRIYVLDMLQQGVDGFSSRKG